MTNQTSEMFEFPKMIFIYGLTATMGFLWLTDMLISPRKITVGWPHIAVLVFFISQAVATAFSIDVHTSVFGYYGRFNGGLLSTLCYALLFFIATQTFDKPSLRRLFVTSLVSSFAVLMWGLPGRVFGVDLSCVLFRGDFSTSCWTNEFRPQERMFSTLGQPNWLGSYFVVHIFMLLLVMMERALQAKSHSSSRKDIFYVVGFVYMMLLFWGVYATGSRSSQIGLAIGLGIVGLVYMRNRLPPVLLRGLILALVLIIVGASVWYMQKLNRSKSQSITHSGTIRLIVWEGALKLAARYPLTGTGPETFAYAYYLTRPAAHNNTTERDFIYNKAHNELLHILATSGVLGLAAYTGMLLVWLKGLFGPKGNLALGASVAALCIINFFGFSTSTAQVLLYLLPVYAFLPDHKELKDEQKPPRKKWIYGGVLILLAAWIYVMQYLRNYVVADITYARALQYQYEGSIDAMQEFQNALELRFEHIYASKFALTATQTAYALSQMAGEEKTYEEQIRTLSRIAIAMQNGAIKASPYNPIYWKERVRVYVILSGLTKGEERDTYEEQARIALQQVKLLAPTDPEVQELQRLVQNKK